MVRLSNLVDILKIKTVLRAHAKEAVRGGHLVQQDNYWVLSCLKV